MLGCRKKHLNIFCFYGIKNEHSFVKSDIIRLSKNKKKDQNTMLNLDITTNLLNLQSILITNIVRSDSLLEIFIETEKKPHICPHCGTSTSYVHDYRHQRINDLPLYKCKTTLVLKKRRYVCPHCGKRFFESYSFLSRYKHSTTRVLASILDSLKDTYSCKLIAQKHFVSTNTVFRLLKELNFSHHPTLPEVLGIDEFKGNAGGEKYNVQLTDIANKRTIDILPCRRREYLIEYFSMFSREERAKVKYLVMDMWDNYKRLSIYFPNATIVIDKFHYVRQIYWTLDKVRIRVQSKLSKYYRIRFKRLRYILHKRFDELNDEDKVAVKQLLTYDEDLSNTWHLKEDFTKITTKGQLKQWLEVTKASKIPEFNDCIKAFEHWLPYLQDSITVPYTNAYTEGKHNLIKVIKRNAFGFRNFHNFRNRILLTA